jgi:ATP-dependent helicase Lhr and Lhr-like helicase
VNPLERWFAERGWAAAKFQKTMWAAMHARESGLLHAPTGAGKTLAAWGGPLLHALKQPRTAPTVLWVTPMRALAADTRKSLELPVRALGLDLEIGKRTGDSSSSERARIRRALPHTLITTPESLSLLLSYADVQAQLKSLQWVIADEWHELLGSKRGVQLELCLARLRALNPQLSVWGLSATIGNLDEALDVLLGGAGPGRLIRADERKKIVIDTLIPTPIERLPWSGHLGLRELPQVLDHIRAARSTLLFTNTRSQAELWMQGLVACAPDIDGQIGLHHASLDRVAREQIEQDLRDGRLRCVVATSSLDLGVDFTDVEQVIQIGSPKGIARLRQRAGRAGHQPGEVSRLKFVPTHALELLEIVAARRAIAAGRIEARRPLGALDLLAQHLVTLALADGFDADAARAEVRQTHAYAHLSDADFARVLNLITQGGEVLKHYPEYQKVGRDERGRYVVSERRIALRHRQSIGTITSDGHINVAYFRGGGLGQVEESFIARLNPGEAFVFAGKTLELVRVRDATAYVRNAAKRSANVPRWAGGKMPLSTELGRSLRELLADPRGPEPELKALAGPLQLQAERSRLPQLNELLIERLDSREGRHWFVYPFAGRHVHEGLAALIAHRLSAQRANTFSFSVNDYGFELVARQPIALDEHAFSALLSSDQLKLDLLASVNAAELSRRRFREIARVAGLIVDGRPGQRKSARQLQASSGLLFDTLSTHDPGHVLLDQALNEVLEFQLDFSALSTTLKRIAHERLMICPTERLTPLAFPLYADRLRGTLSNEAWSERLEGLLKVHG